MNKLLMITALAALVVTAVSVVMHEDDSGTTIHMAGDSTMAIQKASKRPVTGWGEAFASMVCRDVRVVNHAKNGRSTKSFLSQGLWKNLLEQVHADDLVLIQFGHNDQKVSQPELYAGAWQAYRDNLQSFVSDVRALSAESVLLTSIARRAFNSHGDLSHTLGDYPAVTRAVAEAMGVKLIDLNTATYELVAAMGPIASKDLYLHLAPDVHENYADGRQDDTHLSPLGALQVASVVVDELGKMRPELSCN